MSKDRNIDDSELENISGAGDQIQDVTEEKQDPDAPDSSGVGGGSGGGGGGGGNPLDPQGTGGPLRDVQ